MLNKEEEFYGNICKLESIRTRTYKKINKLKELLDISHEERTVTKITKLESEVLILSNILDTLYNTRTVIKDIRDRLLGIEQISDEYIYKRIKERYRNAVNDCVTYSLNDETLNSRVYSLYYKRIATVSNSNIGYIVIGNEYINGEHGFKEYYRADNYKQAVDAYIERFLGDTEALSSIGDLYKLEDFLAPKI